MAWRYIRQKIAERRPGWTLEYIDQLSQQDIGDILGHYDGVQKAKAQIK